MAKAGPISEPIWLRVTDGIDGIGSPDANSPTTATSRSAK